MSPESRNSATPPLGSLLLLLLFAAGVYVQHFELQSTRPEAAAVGRNPVAGIQDVRARLWQDPFEAVARHRGAGGARPVDAAGGGRDAFRDVSTVTRHLDDRLKASRDGVVVLGAMVFGGPYADDAEHRRRQRYAILSGLAMHGYEPYDPDNIGYFALNSDAPVITDRGTQKVTDAEAPEIADRERVKVVETAAPGFGERGTPEIVPFEWLKHDGGKKSILLLWLEEENYIASPRGPLAKLGRLMDALDPGTPLDRLGKLMGMPESRPRSEKLKVKLLGPASSHGLDRLAWELRRNDRLQDPGDIVDRPIEIYTATATAGDAYVPELKGATVDRKLPFLRTTLTDDLLAKALIAELRLRGVDKLCGKEEEYRDYVVLVSEWDTAYGKQLPRQLEEAVLCHGNGHRTAFIQASYLRGLDGKTPGGAAQAESSTSRTAEDKNRPARINPERADGNSQTDYVRRLAGELSDLDSRLRASGRGRVKAVGVLGSDFYDKLVLLQALRPGFPAAVFFTTDLDARYLNSEQYRWTRNLIVASSFGLELAPGLQRWIPPFRDSYQTATFLAMQLAFDETIEGRAGRKRDLLGRWLDYPRLFEIGRTAALDLTPEGAASETARKRAGCSESMTASGVHNCSDVHPQRPRVGMTAGDKLLVIVAILSFTAALMAYSAGARAFAARWRISVPLLTLLIAVVASLELLADWLTQRGAGEPLVWFEGVSIWPSVLIRFVAAALCVWFIWMAFRQFREIGDHLVDEFKLPATACAPSASGTGQSPLLMERLRGWTGAYAWAAPERKSGEAVDVKVLWQEYRRRSGVRQRCLRVTPVALLFLAFGACTIFISGPPPVPYRGEVSWFLEKLSLLVVPLFVFLLILVVDATMLCRTFIRHLQDGRSNWPKDTVKLFEARTGIKDPADRTLMKNAGTLNDWIDVRFIARHTEEVSELIWYPFIVIALMVAARSSLFDNWHMPAGLALILIACAVYAIACAGILQTTAARARETALNCMRAKLVRAKAAPVALAGQIDTLMVAIASLRQGAFRPITEQPLVRAVLVTLSSYGGISIVEYVALLPR